MRSPQRTEISLARNEMDTGVAARPCRYERWVLVAKHIDAVFARLDDGAALARHMTKRSAAMLGSRLEFVPDPVRSGLGAQYGWRGRVLGLPVSVEEEVIEYRPPVAKSWRTTGRPQLIVIASYTLGFSLRDLGAVTEILMWIDYQLPKSGWRVLAGRVLGHRYARWCVDRMAHDAVADSGTVARSNGELA